MSPILMRPKQAFAALLSFSFLLLSTVCVGQTSSAWRSTLSITPPNLGTTATYAAFTEAGAIGNTGLTQLTGDIGTNAGAFTGFPPGQYSGAKHVADPAALVAKNDLTIAWNQANLIPCDTTLSVTLGNGQVLTPRTYCAGPASTLTGDITFDAKGDPNAIFVVKVGGALNVAALTHVLLTNEAQAFNIYWVIDGAISILDNSVFKGTILANGAIHLYGGTTLEGRALSVVGAITMASNIISVPVNGGGPVPSMIVVTPSLGDSVNAGTKHYQITWTGSGINQNKTLEYSLDGGVTWSLIATINSDAMSYSWNVPDTGSTQAMVRVTDGNQLSARSGLFTIVANAPPVGTITVLTPRASDVIDGSHQNYQITWTGSNIATTKTIEFSSDGGATWTLIGTISNDATSFNWASVPNIATTQGLIRVTDSKGVTGTSGLFTITTTPGVGSLNSLTLTGLDNNRNIANATPLGISWTFTPDIGTSVEVEYSTDLGMTWTHIATVGTTEVAATSWMTTATGYQNPVYVRITSSKGMTLTSQAFSIGSVARVEAGRASGYSVGNYPNPVTSSTAISFELPVPTDVSITISDALGRQIVRLPSEHYSAGSHTVDFDASRLTPGAYRYSLQAGATTLSGKMLIVR